MKKLRIIEDQFAQSIYYLDKIESLNLDTYVLRNGKADHKVSYTTKFVIMRRWSWAYLIAH